MHFLKWVQIDRPYKSILYKERGKHATHFGPLYGGSTVFATSEKVLVTHAPIPAYDWLKSVLGRTEGKTSKYSAL